MAYSYTTLLTENLSSRTTRIWYGYDTGSGIQLHMRLEQAAGDAGDIKVLDKEVYLHGATVVSLLPPALPLGIVWTTLRDENLDNQAHRLIRGFATPEGNVIVHRYTYVDFNFDGTVKRFYVDEDVQIIEQATISGTDVVGGAGGGSGGFIVHDLDNHDPVTLAELNAIISDATLINTGDSRLSDARTPTTHASTHEDGGADEISVAGLSGTLADDQTPLTTKGDLLTYNGGEVRLPVGTTGDLLFADATEATGLIWTTLPAADKLLSVLYEHVAIATAPDANDRQTFTLAEPPLPLSLYGSTPSDYWIYAVYNNGVKQKHVAATPGVREYTMASSTQVTVGGLNTNDEIEIVYLAIPTSGG